MATALAFVAVGASIPAEPGMRREAEATEAAFTAVTAVTAVTTAE
jgi:hypothetical protein